MEKINSTEEKVNQVTVEIGRLERVLVYLKNKQEEGKITETHIKTSQRASQGPSLPGPIPDRSTTFRGGATVIPL